MVAERLWMNFLKRECEEGWEQASKAALETDGLKENPAQNPVSLDRVRVILA